MCRCFGHCFAGGQVVFRTFQRVSGQSLVLSMSRSTKPKIAESWINTASIELQVDPTLLMSVEELNACADTETSICSTWQPILSSSWSQQHVRSLCSVLVCTYVGVCVRVRIECVCVCVRECM